MTFETVDVAFKALQDFPLGATPKQISAAVGWTRSRASSVLGRMAMYDIIDRAPGPKSKAPVPEYVYTIRKVANV